MFRLAQLALLLLAAFAAVLACGDQQPQELVPPSATPSTTTTAAPKATQTPEVPPVVSRVIEAAQTRDATLLAQLLRPVRMSCGSQGPFGNPPGDCGADPKMGRLTKPASAVVDVYPESTCEYEIDEMNAQSLASRWAPALGELAAIVRLTKQPVFPAEPIFPNGGDYGVVFAGAAQGGALNAARMVVIYQDGVVLLDAACGGDARTFLNGHPRYGTPEVIRRGPAFPSS